MVGMKFVDNQNIATCLSDPPASRQEFKSMVHCLNTCRISHAIRSNPVIYKSLVSGFWEKVVFNQKGANGAGSINSILKGKKVVVIEQIIREVLRFGDQPSSLTEIQTDLILEVLEKIGYEGTFPPTMKKLFPPYWSFLSQTFVICVSGRIGEHMSYLFHPSVSLLL